MSAISRRVRGKPGLLRRQQLLPQFQLGAALRHNNPALQQEGPQLIDHRRGGHPSRQRDGTRLADQSVAGAVRALQVKPYLALEFDKAHGEPSATGLRSARGSQPGAAGGRDGPFHKHNAARRRHTLRARTRVTNALGALLRSWPSYEAGLRRRGGLTLWVEEAALAGWQAPRRSTPGGQPRYSDLPIELVLTLRLVFHLALRQAEGFARSVLQLLGMVLPVPDHTTLGRRAETLTLPRPTEVDVAVHTPNRMLGRTVTVLAILEAA